MGRLQRYLRRLPDPEWEALRADAQAELGEKTLVLLDRLRRTGAPVSLSPSEKELLKRGERWIWRRLYFSHQQAYSIRSTPPPEWILSGAIAYYEKGLNEEAIALLQTYIPVPYVWKLDFMLRRSLWEMEAMQIQESARTLSMLQRHLTKLADSVWQQRLQLTLWRLLHEYGGSYTPVAQKYLRRIRAILTRKAGRSAASPSDKLVAYNLQSLCAIARGDIQEAIRLYEEIATAQHPRIHAHHLNGWLHYLMGRYELTRILATLQHLQYPLNAHEQAVFVNRLLLTIALYGTPPFIRRHLRELEGWYRQKGGVLTENRFAWTQVLWVSGEPDRAASEMEALLEHRYVTPLSFLQGRILLNLIYADAGQGRALYSNFRKTLYLLRSRQAQIASAHLLQQIIRGLYRSRFSPPTLRRAVHEWKAHLASFPAEKLLWQLTLLPDWLAARQQQKDWLALRRPDPAMEKLIYSAGHLLG